MLCLLKGRNPGMKGLLLMTNSDVLIVGAGPVGMTMALELTRYGVKVRIVDQAAHRTDLSKALVVWSRTLELMDRAGIADKMVAAGYKVEAAHLTADKQTIGRLTFDGVQSAYRFALMLPQSETERILEESLAELGIKVDREVELLSFNDKDDTVVATLRHANGTEETTEAAWLIGCDGAHSTARQQLGMEFTGKTSPIDWVLADVHLEGLPRIPEIHAVWHSDGVLLTFPIEDTRYRIIADAGTVPGGEAQLPQPTLQDIQNILDKRFPGGARATDAVWLSAFRISERKVADYRAGRVFVAGDAAHIHSPAGGQGMNTGMHDACNLAWKLALVVRGAAPEKLLDSYSEERSPIAAEVLKVTGRVTEMAMLQNKLAQEVRNHLVHLMMGLTPVRKLAANLASEVTLGYAHSPLNGGHGDPAPGKRAPIRVDEPPVGAGDAPRFAVFGDADGMPAGFLQKYASVVEQKLRAPFAEGGLWVVRPDGYTGLAAKKGEWDAVARYFDAIIAKGRAEQWLVACG